ncbi:DUF7847 domain-containing protein [Haloferax volcanii]|uniref:DUF7847 domain-containing protein n=1 Tax=Haloferax volcanii JCM 10717 TaxID=1227458 RepID=M0I7T1_HALVO|nr:hypothetical protein [Haloferax alexandrinus]ELZ92037.1 hypothetical protein C452_05433 [Haloferax alexandrinus JCM 10717]
MAAISSLQTALRGIRSNPVLFLGSLALGLITLPQLATQLAQIPFVPTILMAVTFFVTPFVAAGLYGMADEAVGRGGSGSTSLSTLRAVGREKYVSVLLANFVQLGIVLAFGIVFVIIVVAVAVSLGLGGLAASGGDVSNLALGGGFLVGIAVLGLLGLVYLVVSFLIQFYPVAVVVGDKGPVESFGESYRLVRHNVVPTLGYSVIRFVVGLVVSIPATGVILFVSFQSVQQVQDAANPAVAQAGVGFAPMEIAAIAVLSIATQTILAAFQYTYAVAFFEAHDAGTDGTTGTAGPDIDGDAAIPQFE